MTLEAGGAETSTSKTSNKRRNRRRKAVAAVVALTLIATANPAAGILGLLNGLLSPITGLLQPLLGGEDGTTPAIPLDLDVRQLVEDTVENLTGTVESLLIPDDGAPLFPPSFETLADLNPLESLDPVIEDVLVPGVLEPVDNVIGELPPVSARVRVAGNNVYDVLDAGVGVVRDALEPLDLDPAAYTVRTIYEAPNGQSMEATRDGLVDIPTLIDVNDNGTADLSVELRFITARPSLRVIKLPGAPSPLPVSVEAFVALDGWDQPQRLAVGYDALDATAPGAWRATLVDDGLSSGDLAVELHTTSPGDTLALIAGIFEAGQGGVRENPTDVRISFTPVPVDVNLTAAGALEGLDAATFSIDTSEPSLVDASIRSIQGGDTIEAGLVIDRVPGSVSLGFVRVGNQGVELNYSASGPVDLLAFRVTELSGGVERRAIVGFEGIQATSATFTASAEDFSFSASAPIEAVFVEVFDSSGLIDRATTLRARLVGLPDSFEVDIDDDSSFGFSAGDGVLGLLEFQLTSGPDHILPAETDGVLLEDVPEHFVTFVRLTNLRSVSISTGDTTAANLRTLGGRPFVASVERGDASGTELLVARLSELPADVDIALTEQADGIELDYAASAVVNLLEVSIARTGDSTLSAALAVHSLPTALQMVLAEENIQWSASSGVPLVLAEISDPAGLAGRATNIQASLVDVPAAFSVGLAGGGVTFDVPSGSIGLVELFASDGDTDIGVPEGVDGIVLVDTLSSFGAAVRITGLRGVTLVPDPIELTLRTDGARVFEILIDTEDEEGSTEIRATIDQLPEEVSLRVEDLDETPSLSYQASDVVELLLASITTHDDTPSPTVMSLEVHDLPTALSIALGEELITYEANGTVPLLRAEITDDDGLAGLANRMFVELVDLPTAFTAGLGDGETVSIDAGDEVIGSLYALITSGPELAFSGDGLLLSDTPDDFVAVLQIEGLRAVTFSPTEEAAAIALHTVGGRLFKLDIYQEDEEGGTTHVLAELDVLPAEVSVSLAGEPGGDLGLHYTASGVMNQLRANLVQTTPDEAPTTANIEVDGLPTELSLTVAEEDGITYAASDGVLRLAVDISSPDGLFDRATDLSLLALDLPTGITAFIDAEEGGLSAATSGGPVGLVEALFTSDPGAEVALDEGVNGLVLRDNPDLFAVFMRLNDLNGISFAQTETGTALGLQTAGGRVLEVDAETEDPEEGSSSTIRATLDSLPSSVSIELDESEDGDRLLNYSAMEGMDRLFADIAFTGPEGTTTFVLEVRDIPKALNLLLGSEGAITYDASERTGELTITATNPEGIFLTATELQAYLEDLPEAFSVELGEEGNLSFEVTEGIELGLLDVLATNGPTVGPTEDVDGAFIVDTEDEFALAMRLEKVRSLGVSPDPIAIEVGTAGGRVFVVDALLDGGVLGGELLEGKVEILAALDKLPEDVRIGFALDEGTQTIELDANAHIEGVAFSLVQTPPGGSPLSADLLIEEAAKEIRLGVDITGAVSYTASEPVRLLAIDAVDPEGLFDRATDLGLRLEQLPKGLELAISEAGEVDITTADGKLGLMEALITSGPDTRVADGFDGIRYEDLADFVVSARFSNLTTGQVAQVPQPRVKLETDGGRPLSLLLLESEPGKPGRRGTGIAYTEANLLNLPTLVDLELLEGAAGAININYQASQTATSLFFETNAGDKWVTQATISNPVPASFKACQTDNTGCLPVPNPPNAGATATGTPGSLNQSTANIGSFGFIASQHTTLNIWDCSRPLNTNCNPTNFGGASIATHINNFRIKTFQFAGDINQSGLQASGRLYVNTVAPGLAYNQANSDIVQSGSIRNRDGSTRLEFTFPNGFRAWDRYRSFDRFPSLPFFGTRIRASRGGIVCPSGTNMSVTVNFIFDLTFNATGLLGC